jgi:Transposase domain (DUF772)
MITSKSPRKVLKLAHKLGQKILPAYGSHFSRKDFTSAQLFACLVLREHQRKSFRGLEALLIDSPQWLADIGLSKAPDHNTLCRAFDRFMKPALARSMLDLMIKLARQQKILRRNKRKPLAIDSSMFESRHVSRHFERRRRDSALAAAKKARENGAKTSIAADAASSEISPSSRFPATAHRT